MLYPTPEKVIEYATKLSESSEERMIEEEPNLESETNKIQFDQLRALADRDPLHELHEQEKKTIWALRRHCLHEIPTLLSKLLHCVEWNDHRLFRSHFSSSSESQVLEN